VSQNELTISIDNFNGPLDVLLHMIRTQELDIFDLPIISVTDQFLDYLDKNLDPNLDSASEYLYMASTLIKIKSRYLLPLKAENDEDQENIDPRTELVQALIEYQQFNAIVPEFQEMQDERGKSYLRAPSEVPEELEKIPLASGVTLEDLQQAFVKIVRRQMDTAPKTRNIERETFSVADKMNQIVTKFKLSPDTPLNFEELFVDSVNNDEMITTFLAVLELAKEQVVLIQKKEGEFYLTKGMENNENE
jgi:segregation and condensation protein A